MRRALRAVVPLALVLPVVPVAAASPRPTPACALCGPAFADVADDCARERGLPESNVTVTHSRATVRVHENGTATWRVRNEPADGPGAGAASAEDASVVPEPPRVSRGGAKRGR